jgi:phosphatidate cytidylyltransferase
MDANLKVRITTAAVAIPGLVWLVGWSPSWLFSAVLLVVTFAALSEYFALVFPHGRRDRWLGISFGLALSAFVFLEDRYPLTHWLGILLILTFSLYLFTPGELSERLNRLVWSLLGAIYAGFLIPHWILLFRAPEGRAWVFWVLSVIMLGDTAAYFIGRCFGVRKLAPQLSPGKTVAGAWGYLAGAVLGGLAAGKILFDHYSWAEMILLSLVIGVLGQVGDLFESWIKRVSGAKDSGHLLPGHGGLLDRLDSLIFPAVFTTAYLRVFHP